MRDLPFEAATQIYKTQWWDLLKLDDISSISKATAIEMFDTAVNCGQSVAGTFLQRALNALNREEKDYPDVTVDGLIGLQTIAALRTYIRVRSEQGEKVLVRTLNCLQGAAYVSMTERRETQEQFMYGWMLNRVS